MKLYGKVRQIDYDENTIRIRVEAADGGRFSDGMTQLAGAMLDQLTVSVELASPLAGTPQEGATEK